MYIQRKRHYKCKIPEIKAEDYNHDSSITLKNCLRLETEIPFNSNRTSRNHENNKWTWKEVQYILSHIKQNRSLSGAMKALYRNAYSKP